VSKMTRYLKCCAWEPRVLTTAADDRADDLPIEIEADAITRVAPQFDVLTLPRAILGRTVASRRTRSTMIRRSRLAWQLGMAYRQVACLPDPQIGWLRPAVREGLRLIEAFRPDVILTSSFPNTSHLVGAKLSRTTGVPWVAEFRDLWTDNHNFRRIALLRMFERRLEASVLRHAAAVVTVSETWAELLQKRFGKPTYVVPNGFDSNDYPDVQPADDRFTLLYTGMFYDGKQDAASLMEGIAALHRAGAITPATFRIQLAGYYLAPVVGAAQATGVGEYIDVTEAVPHRESLALQRRASALLFFDWNDGREKGWYSAKLYEYLGARRPVLSIGPEGTAARQLLDRTGAGVAAATPAETARALVSWVEEFRRTGTVACHSELEQLARYERRQAARLMADVLERHAR